MSKLGRGPDPTIEARQSDEIAESVKVTMQALKDFVGVRDSSKQAHLRSIGSEFGHLISRNISNSRNPQDVIKEIAHFWNEYSLGEMEFERGKATTFRLRHCYDCLGDERGDALCGFKEGFVNAILSDRTGGVASVQETECCSSGGDSCTFEVKMVKHDPHEAGSRSNSYRKVLQ